MSDLEIVVACALAMGYELKPRVGAMTTYGDLFELPWGTQWNPLVDDGQAMTLVKHFQLYVIPWPDGTWNVHLPEGTNEVAHDESLNRAICMAIARLHPPGGGG